MATPAKKNTDNTAAAPPPGATSVPTGGSTWSTDGKQVAKLELVPAGTYDMKLNLAKMTIKASDNNPASPKRVSGVHLVGERDGKKITLFVDFNLSLNPGKDGVVMPQRNGQIVEFAQALGLSFNFQQTVHEYEDADGNMQQVPCLDAAGVAAALKAYDGQPVRVKVIIEKESKDSKTGKVYPAKNKIDNWLPLK